MLNLAPRRLGAQDGYVLVTVLLASAVLLVLATTVLATVDGAQRGVVRDDRTKRAIAAAEAGAALYASRLIADPDYWSKCTDTGQDPVFSGTAGRPVRWKAVDAGDTSAGRAEYTIELLPANGATSCETGNAGSVIDPTSNALRLRVTGRSDGVRRSIVAAYRRGTLLDYVYSTHRETQDPQLYPDAYRTVAAQECSGTRVDRDARRARLEQSYGAGCTEIQFVTGDAINGPMHTNDTSYLICGNPQLGRPGRGDRVEAGGDPPIKSVCGSTSVSVTPNAPTEEPLADVNETLRDVATRSQSPTSPAGEYRFAGKTFIELNGSTMTVRRADGTVVAANKPLPPRGVVYVAENGCATYPTPAPYGDAILAYTSTDEPACSAIAYVKGNASRDLTIASEGDVVINGSVTRTTGERAQLGLVARKNIRVYHPISGASSCTNKAGSLPDVRIEAALLARDHSFIVDNYDHCPKLGTLHVFGAIIQRFRGQVGTGGASGAGTGYLKDYVYDDNLRYRNPPYFPQPAGAPWQKVRSTEQSPSANP